MRKAPIFAAAAAAITIAMMASAPTPALASTCNPEGCKGLSAEELARDRAEIRRLNREQKRYVDRRDAEYARGWEAQKTHAQDMAAYRAKRAEHARQMEEWREAVRRCRAGDYRYCGG